MTQLDLICSSPSAETQAGPVFRKGLRFGYLTALEYIRENRVSWWMVRCDCGTVKRIRQPIFSQPYIKSCGCMRSALCSAANRKHGHTGEGWASKTFRVWSGMRSRCTNPNTPNFKRYGGRGITVCDRWNTFVNFLADMGEAPEGKTLERVDNNAGYSKENCKWATPKEQANNRRNNTFLEFNGRRLNIERWAEEIGVPSNTLWMRINHGKWSIEKALTTPLDPYAGRFVTGRNYR